VAVAHNLGGASLVLVMVLVNYRLRAPRVVKQDAGLHLVGGGELQRYSHL
jgi:cytochrome c oxidase assembly protein subunit 15